MDAFKPTEIERMRLGGNAAWREFFENHAETKMLGTTWEETTIAERYGGEVGSEYKERLSAKVEGREYEPGDSLKKTASGSSAAAAAPAPGSATSKNASRTGTPAGGAAPTSGSRTASPAPSGLSSSNGGGKVKVDDKYFARLGADNASRPDDLPPSQGGKYSGFGNTPAPAAGSRDGGQLPGLDDLQKDPVGAIAKGFGWFASTIGRTAKQVNDEYIQPTAKTVSFYFILFFFSFLSFFFSKKNRMLFIVISIPLLPSSPPIPP